MGVEVNIIIVWSSHLAVNISYPSTHKSHLSLFIYGVTYCKAHIQGVVPSKNASKNPDNILYYQDPVSVSVVVLRKSD